MGQKHEGSQQDRKKQAVTPVMCRTGLCLRREGLSTQGHCALRSLLHMKKERKGGAVNISRSQGASSHQQWLSPSGWEVQEGTSVPGKGHPPSWLSTCARCASAWHPLPSALLTLCPTPQIPTVLQILMPAPTEVSLLAPHLFPSESLSKAVITLFSLFLCLLTRLYD